MILPRYCGGVRPHEKVLKRGYVGGLSPMAHDMTLSEGASSTLTDGRASALSRWFSMLHTEGAVTCSMEKTDIIIVEAAGKRGGSERQE